MIPEIRHVPLIVDGKDIIADMASMEEGVMVAIRGICDAAGIASYSQREKIKADPRFTWHDIMSHDNTGREQVMFCIPVEQVVPWLFTINSNKVKKPEVRENLLRFQTHLGKELYNIAVGQISTERTLKLERQMASVIHQLAEIKKDSADKDVVIASIKEENRVLKETNDSLWKAGRHESSAAGHKMNAAKVRKKATGNAAS